ncbi:MULTISPECIES: winged helix DNA-binding domain-containing protein [Streptomyces]|uniref:winged helix DNA-binding domain-containing protein n=1 Tax=Streptomyces TaxID=1883 RepID=UPI001F313E8D|nr:winged helix DNA-binding domain-containing protein [Streptomyces sp. FB2]MCF2535933.1 winged helix DNA-binding domain-containing protein [Streptomyces sp. FB2]
MTKRRTSTTTKAATTMSGTDPVLSTRALNRATLARQLLLRRSPLSVPEAVTHLVGLQGQEVKPPYYALAARLDGFTPEALSAPLGDRSLVRMVTMRSTIHLHTAADGLTLRPLVQPAREREIGYFRNGLVGVDLDRLATLARDLVEDEPRTMKQLREALSAEWPDADPQSLAVAARCRLPLVQITPRGQWGRSAQVSLTTIEHWLGRPAEPAASADDTVVRYLAAFGPASVKDLQTWAGLTRMRPVFERLRPRLVTFRDENGVELFDLPDAPRPEPDTPAPPRLLPEFDNLLLSHADRTRLIPPANRGRTWQANTFYCPLLVDGFLAGVWRVIGDALVIEPFTDLSRARRTEVTEEAERVLGVLHAQESYDVRFGTVIA